MTITNANFHDKSLIQAIYDSLSYRDELMSKKFETFNGPILFTTNCLVPPRNSTTYSNRVFTTGATGMSGWKRIDKKLPNGHKKFD